MNDEIHGYCPVIWSTCKKGEFNTERPTCIGRFIRGEALGPPPTSQRTKFFPSWNFGKFGLAPRRLSVSAENVDPALSSKRKTFEGRYRNELSPFNCIQ